MKQQPLYPDLSQEQMAVAINALMDEQDMPRLAKQRLKKSVRKKAKQGRLTFANADAEWAYRICAASLMCRHYHWYGWENRSPWARQVSTLPWNWPRWDGSRTNILLVAEQGLGDEIVFASCYNDLAADVEEAWIECDPRLIPIFERSFPKNLHFVTRYLHPRKKIVPRAADYKEFHKDHPVTQFIPCGNVPKLYRHSIQDFPNRRGFLSAAPDLIEKWHSWILEQDVPFAGCSWVGRQGNTKQLSAGVSLQYGEKSHGTLKVPPINLKWDIEECFALIAALGRVVTTTNAVAHMAGALGVPTDVIKPIPIYATNEDGFNNRVQAWWPYEKSDWYPSIKMYRTIKEWEYVHKSK